MYSKIAYKNVKKSFKDYSIYFLTLTLAVCIFYSFNSIESQNAMMEMNKSGKEYVQILTTIISYVSVFVAFILGSLIRNIDSWSTFSYKWIDYRFYSITRTFSGCI